MDDKNISEKEASESEKPIIENKAEGASQSSTAVEIIRFVLYLAFVVVISLLVVKFIAFRSIVDGNSMYPLLSDGDNLIIEKVSYYFDEPERFDVIVFELENDPDTHYIKRIIGLPGETVQVIDGYVYITEPGETEGKLLDTDTYGYEIMNNAYAAADPITLGEGEYFVLGDNRNNSLDSRSVQVGPVDESQITGRAWFRFWPLNKIGLVTHD